MRGPLHVFVELLGGGLPGTTGPCQIGFDFGRQTTADNGGQRCLSQVDLNFGTRDYGCLRGFLHVILNFYMAPRSL